MTDLSDSSASTTERPSLASIADVFTRYGNFTWRRKRHQRRCPWIGRYAASLGDRLCYALGRPTPVTNVLAFCTGICAVCPARSLRS